MGVGRPVRDLKGQTFGKLFVVNQAFVDTKGHAMWNTVCKGGHTRVVRSDKLIQGLATDCKQKGHCHECYEIKEVKDERTNGESVKKSSQAQSEQMESPTSGRQVQDRATQEDSVDRERRETRGRYHQASFDSGQRSLIATVVAWFKGLL